MDQSTWVKRAFPTLTRWLRRGVLGAIAIVIMLVILHTVINVVLHRRVEAKLAEIKRAGGAMTLSELVGDPIPDEENAAIHYLYAHSIMRRVLVQEGEHSWRVLNAFETVWPPSMVSQRREQVEERDIQAAKQYLERVRPGIDAEGKEIELAARHIFERMEPGLQVVKDARALGRAQFLSDYSLNVDAIGPLTLPRLATMRAVARYVASAAVLAARDGDIDEAFDLISSGLHLANSLRDEPMLIVRLVRIAVGGMAIDALYEVLDENYPPDRHLPRVVAELAELRNRKHFVTALQGERCFLLQRDRQLMAASRVARPFRLLDELAYLEYTEEIIQLAALPSYRSRDVVRELEREVGTISKLKIAARTQIPIFSRALQSQDRLVAQCDLAEMAIYLKQYKKKTGSYPAKLDQIVSEFTRELPLDPFVGRPYIYHKEGDGFVLYSVALNQVDDGGKPDWGEGDIVWR